jgi:hypothetical protein
MHRMSGGYRQSGGRQRSMKTSPLLAPVGCYFRHAPADSAPLMAILAPWYGRALMVITGRR